MRRFSAVGFFAVLAFVVLLALPLVAGAAPIYVSVAGSDTAGNGSIGNPYRTIQHAVDVAVSGDDVHVGPGTFYNSVLMKDGVSLFGAGAENTLLTETGGAPVVTAAAIGASTSISGFTVSGAGHGIYCINGSTLTITNNDISGNGYSGISCSSSSPSITDNDVIDNLHGIFCVGGSPAIDNNVIRYNDGSGIGCNGSSPSITNDDIYGNDQGISLSGGSPTIINDNIWGNDYENIYCDSSASPIIINDTISASSTGIECDSSCSLTIINCTITGNSYQGIYCSSTSSASITNCIVWNPGATELTGCTATYSDIYGGAPGTGNIAAAPSFMDAAARNFHLKGDSPCIDAGTSTGAPSTDMNGVARPQGSGYDIGAYEYSTCQLHYTAGLGGTLLGTALQTVDYGGSGTAVTAVPNTGYHFLGWSDGFDRATRTDIEVIEAVDVTANFASDVLATSLSFSAPSTSSYASAKVSGYLEDSGGSPISGKPVKIQYYSGGWKTAATVYTSSAGYFSRTMAPKAKTKYRAYFAGDAAYLEKTSAEKTVLPQVRLTRTTSWSSLSRYKAYYAKGYIEPYHSTRNSNKVKIRAYKKGSDKKWHYVKSFTASYLYSSKSKTAYKAKVVLTSKGSWKLVAYHATDSTNYKTYGSADYITVK